MSVIFEGVKMPTACCFVDGEHSEFDFEYCRFYNICKQRETVKTNYKPSDCPVKALERELTTKNTFAFDCISRGQALNEFCIYNSDDSIGVDKVRNYLKALTPVVSIEPNWISVGERLPEPNAHDGLIVSHYLIQNEYEDMLVASYDGIGWKQMYQYEYLKDNVVAWMPLPTPYELEESEE